MYIELDQGCVTNAAKAVDLTGLDDQNVTCSGFEFLSVDGPEPAAFPHELDFVVRVTMGPWTTPGEGAEEEDGDIHVAVIGPDEVVRATLKGQVLLTNAVHPVDAPDEWLLSSELRANGKLSCASDTGKQPAR
jgi:hypothetical protein